jgi:hypothetical protein
MFFSRQQVKKVEQPPEAGVTSSYLFMGERW